MKLFGIPYRVHLSFFIIVALLGMMTGGDVVSLVLWLGIVLVGVTIHELGHALTARAFGRQPEIQLHGMGGTTTWSADPPLSHGRRILVTLAGPFAGFAVGGLVLLTRALFVDPAGPVEPRIEEAVYLALWVNVGWGVLNLVPILPLDGGKVVATAFEAGLGERGTKAAHVVSVAVAAVAVGLALWAGYLYAAILVAWLALSNVQALRGGGARHPGRLRTAMNQAMDGIRRRDVDAVREAGGRLRGRPGTDEGAVRALLGAWALAAEGRPEEARRRFEALPHGVSRAPALRGWMELAAGDAEAARAAFESTDPPDPGVVVALSRLGRLDEALERVRTSGGRGLGPGFLHLLQLEAWEAGNLSASAEAGAVLHGLTGDPASAYNVACAEARAGRPDRAVAWLERIADDPWLTVETLDEDDDLAPIRGRGDFAALRERVAARK